MHMGFHITAEASQLSDPVNHVLLWSGGAVHQLQVAAIFQQVGVVYVSGLLLYKCWRVYNFSGLVADSVVLINKDRTSAAVWLHQ